MINFLKDLLFLIKKIFFSEKNLLKKRILRSIKNDYEKEIKILPKLIKEGTDTLDIGVFRGIYSYELARLSNHVHSFEANPIIYKYLEKNLTKIIKNITLYNYALSNQIGISSLRVPLRRKTLFSSQFEEKYRAGMGTIHNINKFDEFDTFDVKTTKLDDLKFNNKISFIKIDVEGHELEVIEGAQKFLIKHRPNLLIEIEERHSGKLLYESINYIKKFNYESYIFQNNSLVKINNFNKLNNENNFIFIPIS